MQRQTLDTALRAAREKQQSSTSDDREAPNYLVVALRRNATHMDQIVQRRVWLHQPPPPDSKY